MRPRSAALDRFAGVNLLGPTLHMGIALDIKELHLKNELEKAELRFRVKSDELID